MLCADMHKFAAFSLAYVERWLLDEMLEGALYIALACRF